jgi:hypothetical protein
MRFVIDIIIILVFSITAFFLYQNYWDDLKNSLFQSEPNYEIYLGSTALGVTLADDYEERIRGLSGVPFLEDFGGKLFIYDTDERHGIWMKDMLMPIDILWIDKNLTIVYIVKNVNPNTYPEVFYPPTNARFVVETNAHFVSSFKIGVGDRMILPTHLLPADIKENLH